MTESVFCSTIIPTIGRFSLDRAVESVLHQSFFAAAFEMIVVNDSGLPLPPAPWQTAERVQILHTSRRDKSVARNAGAAVAKGKYLHFLDDDDWLLPGALETFWDLAQAHPSEALLYGGARLVDRQRKPLLELRHKLSGNCFVHMMAGEWIPTGAYVIANGTFFQVGGYDPLMPAGEDSDLCRRLALRGDFAGAESVVVCACMGQQGSTTDYGSLSTYSRRARERILDAPGVFKRMRNSANDSYWRGRIVRAYLTSLVWNLQHRRLARAIGRGAMGLLGLATSGWHVFSLAFWRAVARSHASFAFTHALRSKARLRSKAHLSGGTWFAGAPDTVMCGREVNE